MAWAEVLVDKLKYRSHSHPRNRNYLFYAFKSYKKGQKIYDTCQGQRNDADQHFEHFYRNFGLLCVVGMRALGGRLFAYYLKKLTQINPRAR